MNYEDAKRIIEAGNNKENPLSEFIDKKKLDKAIAEAQKVIDNANSISNEDYQKGRTINTIEKRLLEARQELKDIQFGIDQLESFKNLSPDELRQLADLKELRDDLLDEVQVLEYAYAKKNKSNDIKSIVDERKYYKNLLATYKTQLKEVEAKKAPQEIIDRIKEDIEFADSKIKELTGKIQEKDESKLSEFAKEETKPSEMTDNPEEKDTDDSPKITDEEAIAAANALTGETVVAEKTPEEKDADDSPEIAPEEAIATANAAGASTSVDDMIEAAKNNHSDSKGKQKLRNIHTWSEKLKNGVKEHSAVITGALVAIAATATFLLGYPAMAAALANAGLISETAIAAYAAKKSGVLGK